MTNFTYTQPAKEAAIAAAFAPVAHFSPDGPEEDEALLSSL